MDLKSIKLSVSGQQVTALDGPDVLVAGTTGVYSAEFSFDGSWDGYTKMAVFASGGVKREALLTDGGCAVPWEVLEAGRPLSIGVYGIQGEKLLPTVWTGPLGVVQCGASQADPAQEQTPELWQQVLTALGPLEELQTADKSSLVAAINEVCQSGGAGNSGVSVTDAAIDGSGHLIVTLSDGKTVDAGYVIGPKGDTGAQGPAGPAGADGKDGESASVDATLTQEGQAADAKAVGDALNQKLSRSGGTLSGKYVMPTNNESVGFINSADIKIMGYGGGSFKVGDTGYPLVFRGSGENPLYGDKTLLLDGDVYSKEEIDAALGAYITDVAALIGGEA